MNISDRIVDKLTIAAGLMGTKELAKEIGCAYSSLSAPLLHLAESGVIQKYEQAPGKPAAYRMKPPSGVVEAETVLDPHPPYEAVLELANKGEGTAYSSSDVDELISLTKEIGDLEAKRLRTIKTRNALASKMKGETS